MSQDEFDNFLRTTDGEDLNSDLLNPRLESIDVRLNTLEDSLGFLGDIFGEGVFNLDSQTVVGTAFLGAVVNSNEFHLQPGASVIKGFIFQSLSITTLNFFGLAAGTYLIQMSLDGSIGIFSADSAQRLALYKVDFDGSLHGIVDQRVFITNPKILLTELIEGRKTNAFILATNAGPFTVVTGTNDILNLSLDSQPTLSIELPTGTQTAASICTAINAALVASVNYESIYQSVASTIDYDGTGSRVILRSTKNGLGQVLIGDGTANSLLGFRTTGEASIGVTYSNIDARLDFNEESSSSLLKLHEADKNIHHNKIHDINGSDHTGSLDESKITFNITTGHHHNGIDSKKINFSDIDTVGVINPFETTLTEAESAGVTKYGSNGPQIKQGSTSATDSVNDLQNIADASISLEDDLNQVRSVLRELKDPNESFSTPLTNISINPSGDNKVSLKEVTDIVGNITVGGLVDGLKVIPNTLPHNNLLQDASYFNNPHNTTLQQGRNASVSHDSEARIAPLTETSTDPAILKIGRQDPNNISFDQDGNIHFHANQTVDGMQPSTHLADPNAHHDKIHSHTTADGSGALDLNDLNTTNQLPLAKVQDAQSATSFNTHDHDGTNSEQVSYNNLLDKPTAFPTASHHHASGDNTGSLDLGNLDTTGQLPLNKVEGFNSGIFTLNSDLVVNQALAVNNNVTLGNNGTEVDINASVLSINSATSINGDVTISSNAGANQLTVLADSTFSGKVRVPVSITDSDEAASKAYVDNAITFGGGGASASGVSYDNTSSGLAATNIQSAIDELKTDLNGEITSINTKVSKTGDSMSGLLTLSAGATVPSGQHIVLTSLPTNSTDAANKSYVDSAVSASSGAVLRTGDTMTGNLTMASGASILLPTGDSNMIFGTADNAPSSITLNEDGINVRGANGINIRGVSDPNAQTGIGAGQIVVRAGFGDPFTIIGSAGNGGSNLKGNFTVQDGNIYTQLSSGHTIQFDTNDIVFKIDGTTSNILLGFDDNLKTVGIRSNTTFSRAVIIDGLTTFNGSATIPTGKNLTIIDAPANNTDAANKLYVDTQVAGVSAGSTTASAVSYDHTTSGLAATNVQAALDELATSSSSGLLAANNTWTGSNTFNQQILSPNGINITTTSATPFSIQSAGTASAIVANINMTGNDTIGLQVSSSGTNTSSIGIYSAMNHGNAGVFHSQNTSADLTVDILNYGTGDALQLGAFTTSNALIVNSGIVNLVSAAHVAVPTPTNTNDATTKNYVDTAISGVSVTPQFADNVFRIQDNADATKQLAFEVSGIATATTRTLTAPNFNGTIATLAGTETFTNKTLTSPVINSPTGITKSDVGLSSVDNTSDITKNAASVTLTNKTLNNTNTVTLKDTLFILQDDGDATKQVQFQLSGLTTATTRTLTVPDISDTLTTLTATQILTNKTLTSPSISNPTLTTRIVDKLIDLGTVTGSVAIDASQGNIFKMVTGASNISGFSITNPADGQRITLRIRQGASARLVTGLGANISFGTDILSYTATATANKTDYLGLVYNADNTIWNLVAVTKGF
jgi:hypothetical protein